MAKTVYKWAKPEEKTLSYFVISSDWFSFRPWTHQGTKVKYWYDYRQEWKKDVIIEYKYFGPFAVMTATLIE